MSIDALRQRYEAAGQGHLLHFWPKLSEAERAQLKQQLEDLDIERVNRIYKKAVGGEAEAAAQQGQEVIEPLPEDWVGPPCTDPYADFAFTLHRATLHTYRAYFDIRSEHLRKVFETAIGNLEGISWTALPLRVSIIT